MHDSAEKEKVGKESLNWAVLIDADNISPQYVDEIFRKVGELGGKVLARKAYGNLSSFMGGHGWQDAIRRYGVEAYPQVGLIDQKNVADMVMMLDAMEMWATHSYGGMVIVSSDSDFTFLVRRLRDRGMRVCVIGDSHAVASLRESCEQFIELSPLSPAKTVNETSCPEHESKGEAVAPIQEMVSVEPVREVVAEPCPVSPVMPQEETVAPSAPSTVTQPTPYQRMVTLLQELRCESLSTLQHTILTQWSKPLEEVDRITRAMARDGFIRIDAGTGHVDWLDKVYEGKAKKAPSVTVLPKVTWADLELMPKKPEDVTPAERKRLIDLMRQKRCTDLSACRNCLPPDKRQWLAYLIQIMMCQKLIVFDKASGAITWN